MVDSTARVCRMSCGCGCLTVTAEGEQCWWHGPLLRVPSGAADVRQTAAGVVESTIYDVGGGAPSTHSPSSAFQIGAPALIASMISRAPANASPRCGADAATTTDGSLSGTRPMRCSAA